MSTVSSNGDSMNTHRRFPFALLTTLALAACSAQPAEKPAGPPAGAASTLAAPVVPAAPSLMRGMGTHHHAIATTSDEAQRFFDQGFALVFGFNHEEAVRSFTRAAELDPKAAMPHWGIAWALGPNYNADVDDQRAKQANTAIAKALELSKDSPEAERAYIEAMALRFPADAKPDRAALARKYAAAMRDLSQRYPDDLDAATLCAESLMNLNAWRLWSLNGKPTEGTLEIVAVLESVLARDPNHIGANHYYIHTVEASPNPARALASAARLDSLAPAAGHLTHMPAHIYARVGDHAAAAHANQAGAQADREYFKTAGTDSLYAMAYYTHNLHFLTDSEMMRGRLAPALKAADELSDRLAPHTQMMPMIESMITMKTSVLLRFGKHDDILAIASPPADHPVEVAWWHFARGVALARTGKTTDAEMERSGLAAAILKVPNEALFGGTGLVSAKPVLALAATVLDARIVWAKGSKDEAIRLWTRAVAAADQMPYDEPPVFYYPVRESLGAALLLDGKAAEAERVFRDDLVRHPRNARSLFGLHASLVKHGKNADADWVKRAFDSAWKDADAPLTIESL
jgi:tetratricopeptide (TPR) repeat protein